MNNCKHAALGLFSLLMLVGCSIDDSAQPSSNGVGEGELSFTRTIVDFAPDGSYTVTVSAIPASRANLGTIGNVDNTPESLTVDSGCNTADLRIWDQTNYAGDELCLTGSSGFVDLQTLCRVHGFDGLCHGYWGGWMKSFSTGNATAQFWNNGAGGAYCGHACEVLISDGTSKSGVSPNTLNSCETASRWAARGGFCEPS